MSGLCPFPILIAALCATVSGWSAIPCGLQGPWLTPAGDRPVDAAGAGLAEAASTQRGAIIEEHEP